MPDQRRPFLSLVFPRLFSAPADAPAPAQIEADATFNGALGYRDHGSSMGELLGTGLGYIRSWITGMGGAYDTGEAAEINVGRRALTTTELAAWCGVGLYDKVCGIWAKWALYRGPRVIVDGEEDKEAHDVLRQLRVNVKLRDWGTRAKKEGVSGLLIVTDDPGEWMQPLDPNRVHKLRAVHALGREEMTPGPPSDDFAEEGFRLPQWVDVRFILPDGRGRTQAQCVRVHPSRCLLLFGMDPVRSVATVATQIADDWDGYCRPAVAAWHQELVGVLIMGNARRRGAQELSLLTLSVTPMDSQGARYNAQWADALKERHLQFFRQRSSQGGIATMPGEVVNRLNAQLTGLDLLDDGCSLDLARVTDIPVVLLHKDAPGGLSTDSTSWLRQWLAQVEDYQANDLGPGFDVLARCALSSVGKPGATYTIEWPELTDEDVQELAGADLTRTQAAQVALSSGAVSSEEARAYMRGEAWESVLAPNRAEDEEERAIAEQIAAAFAGRDIKRLSAALRKLKPGESAKVPATGQMGTSGQQEPAKDAEETYTPPDTMRNNARKVLEWKDKYGDEVQGMTETGRNRARQLAKGGKLTRKTVGEIAGFARHRKNAEVNHKYKDEPWRDAGYVAWLGCGGTTGIEWAAEIVSRDSIVMDADFSGKAMVSIQIDDEGREAIAELRAKAQDIVGPLEGYDVGEPWDGGIHDHVTLLYIGDVDESAMPEIIEVSKAAAETVPGFMLVPNGIVVFERSERTEGRYCIVVSFGDPFLPRLNDGLLRGNAQHVSAKQYPTFTAHATLGFVNVINKEQRSKLAGLVTGHQDRIATVEEVVVHYGGEIVATIPLTGESE